MGEDAGFSWDQKSVTASSDWGLDIGVPLRGVELASDDLEILCSRLSRRLHVTSVEWCSVKTYSYVHVFGWLPPGHDQLRHLRFEVQADGVLATVLADRRTGWSVGDEIVLGFTRTQG